MNLTLKIILIILIVILLLCNAFHSLTITEGLVQFSVVIFLYILKILLIIVSHRIFITILFTLFVYFKYNTYLDYIKGTIKTTDEETLLNIFGSKIYKSIEFNPPIKTSYTSLDNTIQFTLKDYYINSAYRPYLIGDDKSKPTTKAFKYIINAGARYLTFDIYEDLINFNENSYYIPTIRTAHNMEGIAFNDVMIALNKTLPFNQNPDYPLILHFNFYNQNTDTQVVQNGFKHRTSYDYIYNSIINIKEFNERFGLLGNNQFGYGGIRVNEASFGHIPYTLAKGRLLLVSNINPQNNELSSKLAPYLYGTIYLPIPVSINIKKQASTVKEDINPDLYMRHFTYTYDMYNQHNALSTYISTKSTDIINYNKTGVTIIISEDCLDSNVNLSYKNILYNPIKRQATYNPHVLDCMNYGNQIILMKYQYMGENLKAYLQVFNKRAFILKPAVLRESPEKKCKTTIQSPAVSFAEKNTNFLGVIDNQIAF